MINAPNTTKIAPIVTSISSNMFPISDNVKNKTAAINRVIKKGINPPRLIALLA
jgi:hypothetical protein